ncbi:MAG TPA: ribonuclease domain-containing protein [Blastocatellia bacterium]|nr:ribonuclease domain-containing protein [Blastocatellia bacterium]
MWGLSDKARSPFGHPLLQDLEQQVRECNQYGVSSRWRREVFRNKYNDLPPRPFGHYYEFRLAAENYRLVLGNDGEVFVTWDHYRNFLQVFRVPGAFPPQRPPLQAPPDE